MKKIILNRNVALITGLLLIFPTAYFIVSAWLNFSFGYPTFWTVIEPVFLNPANKKMGFNINLLILFGPAVAILINLRQVIQWKVSSSPEALHIQLQVKKYTWNWISIFTATFCLGTLALYLVAENW
jgi:hypothetical protein